MPHTAPVAAADSGGPATTGRDRQVAPDGGGLVSSGSGSTASVGVAGTGGLAAAGSGAPVVSGSAPGDCSSGGSDPWPRWRGPSGLGIPHVPRGHPPPASSLGRDTPGDPRRSSPRCACIWRPDLIGSMRSSPGPSVFASRPEDSQSFADSCTTCSIAAGPSMQPPVTRRRCSSRESRTGRGASATTIRDSTPSRTL